ncbi:MAG: drug/metabolite transporter (DMT)-like permease [Candidatus Azotimanducaceae bacterium]|jgi:drug/metabolite transporter (DMT)-like permease
MTENEVDQVSNSRQYFGIGMVLLGAIVIGLMPSATKIAYQEGANPLAVITLRCIIGMLGIGVYMLLSNRSFKIAKTALRYSTLSGVAQVFNSIGLLGALAYLDVSITVLIFSCFPFLIVIVEHYTGRSKMTLFVMGCITLALAGLAMALSLSFENLNPIGLLLAVVALISVTFMILIVSKSTKQIGTIPANFYMTVWASLYFLIFAILAPLTGLVDAASFPETSRGWIAILVTGITFSLAYVLFFTGASIIGMTRASILSISEPIMVILFAVVILDESLLAVQWVGVLLIIVSLFVMEMPRKKF